MRLKFNVVFVALVATLGGAVFLSAQTDRSGFRVRNDFRVSEGTNYNVLRSQLWEVVGGQVSEKIGNVLILKKTHMRYVRRSIEDSNPIAFEDTSFIAVTNFTGDVLLNEWYLDRGIRVGTYDFNGRPIAFYDLGTDYVPTPEEIAAAQAAQEKAKVDAKIKAAEQKKKAAEIALKANQDAAAKGDAYGLLRMGQRYRDGEGVEKDLTKAKEYLQKAVDAGSPSAADELSKLKQ